MADDPPFDSSLDSALDSATTVPDSARTEIPKPSENRRLAALLELALETPSDARRAALEAIEPDRSLVEFALGLIEGDDPEFLAGPAAQRLSSHHFESMPEAEPDIPGYTVLGLLGRGGMGVVYLAGDDASPDRLVAIKCIDSAFDDRRLDRRFAIEREALARLQHRSIAQLFATGSAVDGRPSVVMEYVDGQPITRYCDDQRLTIEQRLRLFVDVCRGVEHAHRRQLLHRDLKPSNILVATVDGEPTPKIIDFGIARVLDTPAAAEATLTGSALGTPAYMSPEALVAVEGPRDLDTRTDVYSLGVVLYELLVGRRPHEGRTDDPLFPGRILRDEPLRPSTQWRTLDFDSRTTAAEARRLGTHSGATRLAGDLDWVVMKAIEKDRGRRYGSVGELAADIERHLRLDPIEARPPTLRYRADRFVRRHRLPVVAGSIAVLALLLGSAGTTVGMLRARAAAAEATGARDEAEAIVAFLRRIFETSSPFRSDSDRPPSEVTARELLDEGAQRVGEELAHQPVQAARVRTTLGAVYRGLALDEAARIQLSAALADLDRAGASEEDSALRTTIERELAEIALDQNRFDDALVHLERSEVVAREHLEEPERTRELTGCLSVRAKVYRRQARFELAESALGEALEMLHAAPELDQEQLYEIEVTLGYVYFGQERWVEAELHNREALRLAREHFDPGHYRIARRLESLGAAIASQGRSDEATPCFAEAFEIKSAVLPEDHPALAASLHNLGSLALDRGRPDEALESHRKALAIRLQSFGEQSHFTAASREGLGVALTALGRLDEARIEHEKALSARRAVLGAGHPKIASSLEKLADLARTRFDWAAAEAYYREALEVRRVGARELDARLGGAALDLGETLLERGSTGEIPRLLEEAEAQLAEAGGESAELRERVSVLRQRLADLQRGTSHARDDLP